MKKINFKAIAFIAITSFTCQLFAQDATTKAPGDITAADDWEKSNAKVASGKHFAKATLTCRVTSTDNGCSIVFENDIVSPRDAASGLPTGRRLHKPISFYISPSDNTIVEVSSTSNMVSGQASVIKTTTTSPPDVSNATGNPIKGISVKGGRNPGGNQLNKIVVTDGEFKLPADLEDGEYEMSISFTYQKIEFDHKEKANSKSYVSGRFILDIDGGACRSIKEKGVSVRRTQ